MEHVLQIHFLGLPQIFLDGSRIENFPTEKIKFLFFYLLLFRDVRHTRSRLAGLFWGDSPEIQARRALSTALWRLRQWLKSLQFNATSLLLFEDDQVAYNPSSPTWFDIAEFEMQMTRANQLLIQAPETAVESLQRATELYRGDLLEGCYAEWCLVERNRLHELYLQALVHLMVLYGGRHEYEQAITSAKRILNNDPLREEVHRELMKLFVLNEQPAEALQQYHRCERVLKEELGIQPMPKTQVLFHQLIPHSGSIPSELTHSIGNMPHDLSAPKDSFIHRIGTALRHFELAREELTLAIEVLRQTQVDIERDSTPRQT